MPASIVWDLTDRLVETFAAIPGVIVADGDLVTDERGTFLMVGWDDPENDRATSASASQEWASLGNRARNESGTVTCLVVRSQGDRDAKAARDAVRDATDAVENLLRADPNLGGLVPGLQWTGFGPRFELRQWLTEDGAVALCVFDIAFRARL